MQESFAVEKKNEGVFIRKKSVVAIVCTVFIIYSSTVVGLVFGFRDTYSHFKIHHEAFNASETTTITTTTTTTTVTTLNESIKIDYRLPRDLSPYYYDITISTIFHDDIEPNDYNGSVKIYFKCIKETNKIIFHARNLDIFKRSVHVSDLQNNSFNYSQIYYEAENEHFIIELINNLSADKNYSVSVKYKGHLRNDAAGFFKSLYLNNDGKKRWLFASQMESTDARKAFPCFDEPAMKAIFTITALHHESLTAMSNMPIVAKRRMYGFLY